MDRLGPWIPWLIGIVVGMFLTLGVTWPIITTLDEQTQILSETLTDVTGELALCTQAIIRPRTYEPLDRAYTGPGREHF